MALGEILPDEAVGVLVGPSFPAMMRGGEVEPHPALRLDLRIAMELRPVVGGDRLELFRVPPHQGEGGFAGLLHRPGRQLAICT